jgi:hypothetical protein
MPVNPFAIASLLLFCVVLMLRLVQRRNAWRKSNLVWPFYAKTPLVGPEQVLYQRLVTALPGYIVLSKVPVASVLGVKRGHDAKTWTRRLRHLQYDFVVFSKDATVLAGIDVIDHLHSESEPSSAGEIKQRASADAGVRLLRWQAKALPEFAEIQAVFAVPLTQIFEDISSSANASWWPPISSGTSHSRVN